MSQLAARPLSAAGFAPFGDLLEVDPARARPVNDGNALRADLPARLAASAGTPRLALFRVAAQALPLAIPRLERHPQSSQVFFPLSVARFLVVVAPETADGGPDVLRARAFIGQPDQGIHYSAGVWHAPIVALDRDGAFLMLIWEQDTPADCTVEPLPVPLTVHI